MPGESAEPQHELAGSDSLSKHMGVEAGDMLRKLFITVGRKYKVSVGMEVELTSAKKDPECQPKE